MALFNFDFRKKPDIEAIQKHLLTLMGQKEIPYQMAPEEMFPGEAPIQGLQTVQPGMIDQGQAAALAGLAASNAPQVAAQGGGLIGQLLSTAFPELATVKPTTLMQNLQAAGVNLATPEGQQTMLDILKKPQVSITQGSKPLGADAKNWRNPITNQKPPANITLDDAVAQGYVPLTTEEQKTAGAGQQAAPLIASLTETAFGKKGEKSLFPSGKQSAFERAKSGISAMAADITESDPRIVSYNRTKQAFVSQLARLSGQVGTLTDRDVGLVEGLFPRAGFTPETIAKNQFRQIAKLLLSKGVPKQELINLGMPKWSLEEAVNKISPPPGFIED